MTAHICPHVWSYRSSVPTALPNVPADEKIDEKILEVSSVASAERTLIDVEYHHLCKEFICPSIFINPNVNLLCIINGP